MDHWHENRTYFRINSSCSLSRTFVCLLTLVSIFYSLDIWQSCKDIRCGHNEWTNNVTVIIHPLSIDLIGLYAIVSAEWDIIDSQTCKSNNYLRIMQYLHALYFLIIIGNWCANHCDIPWSSSWSNQLLMQWTVLRPLACHWLWALCPCNLWRQELRDRQKFITELLTEQLELILKLSSIFMS